ncbi:hypothetical protein VIGAN_06247500 [Vigna angularis var. angularis]|uniref:Uncharacterized protein n=1 Tax=Vigna angularis var. angularis TaxID=157739 RepID=A0A0S3SEF0_PHAAN|nr:hypothetical protein VIGAN_06247500 [Vigna angularis var. angularis]
MSQTFWSVKLSFSEASEPHPRAQQLLLYHLFCLVSSFCHQIPVLDPRFLPLCSPYHTHYHHQISDHRAVALQPIYQLLH